MHSKTIVMSDDYLHIPVRVGTVRSELKILLEGEALYQFSVELAEEVRSRVHQESLSTWWCGLSGYGTANLHNLNK